MIRFSLMVLTLITTLLFRSGLLASDIVEVLPLTNRIILVKFDDGSVDYPNSLSVDRLNTTLATDAASYRVSSIDDPDYSTSAIPSEIARKSRGTEFVKDVPWSTAKNCFDPTGKPWASEHYIYLILDKELKAGYTYSLNTGSLAANGSDFTFTFDEKESRSEAVHVNTIGYAADAPKYGYVYQWMGDKGGLNLTAYSGNTFHIYKNGEDEPVYSGSLVKRKSASNAETGQPNDTPNKNFLGAEVYECDFSPVTADGEYRLVVEGIGSSYPFKIGNDALWEAYYACGRALYYQRSGIRLAPPYTDGGYIRPVNQNTRVTSDDGTSFEGLLLYSDFPFMQWDDGNGGGDNRDAIREAALGNAIDVAGWYHDAGDWDGYYTHQRIPVLLMLTWEYAPERFADNDLNLPESGNGIPDIIDEASWLIKFNYRLRKELMDKGFSDGGVGGARVCPDIFSEIDGNAQDDKPSWKDHRRYVVTRADAFMTYLYAGQAAQFAYILNRLGKDPGNFPVEMLDHVDPASMTRDTVDWEKEAREAYAWASAPGNQPASSNNYSAEPGVYKMYAASNLYRLTNEEAFHTDAKTELEKVKNSTALEEDERWGVYSYLLADNFTVDKSLLASLETVAIKTADNKNIDAARKRACRWGGIFDMPMLVGQGTTPWMFESIVACALTGDTTYSDAVHTTADYFLGTNPLHTTWATQLGPRPPQAGFHLDSRYNNDWILYPGFVPYGLWSMAYGYTPYTWEIDGVTYQGGHGPWNKDWANFSMYPLMDQWPGHERWNSNIHAPLSTENTVHQNAVYVLLTYGYVNARHNTNAAAAVPITTITLSENTIELTSQGQKDTLHADIDTDSATFGALKWTSGDDRIAHVDGQGRITGVTNGTTAITCSTLDGSAMAGCQVTCTWPEVNVDSIRVEPHHLQLVEGQTAGLQVFFSPADASNKFIDWRYSADGIVEIDDIGMLSALNPGAVVVTAISLNGGKKDSLNVVVVEAVDYLIADFDKRIPLLSRIDNDSAQLYTPGGTNDISATNPLIGLPNNSQRVVRYDRPTGEWKLIGMVLPADSMQDLTGYSQFQFKYFGEGISEFFIALVPDEGDNFEVFVNVESENCWKLFALDLQVGFILKQFNVFVNPRGITNELTCYFDDFTLSGKPAQWYNGLKVSDSKLEMVQGEDYILVAESDGHPFTWISTDLSVVTVDQDGLVTAVGLGTARIRAVPLYGSAAECMVTVVEQTTSNAGGIFHNENPVKPFQVYPNPSDDIFTVSGSDHFERIEIYNMLGEVMLRIPGNDRREININTSTLNKGIYIIKATTFEKRHYFSKVMIR